MQSDKSKKNRRKPRLYISKRGLNNWVSFKMFSRIAFDCYHKGLTVEKIFNYYQNSGLEYLKNDAPTIDHLDGNWRNNTKENLFEMTRADNIEKFNNQKKYKGIFHVALANDGTFCRVQFAYSTSRGNVYVFRCRCKDGESINKCLRYFWKSKSRWKIRERRDGIPCNSDYTVIRYKHFVPLIGQVRSIMPINQYELAEKMVSLPEDEFPLFEEDKQK